MSPDLAGGAPSAQSAGRIRASLPQPRCRVPGSSASHPGLRVADSGRVLAVYRPVSLRRALRNLRENAAVYGGLATVRIERDDDEVRVVVGDEGSGVPEADLKRVFGPFVRLEVSRSRDTRDSSLGLAIARSIVRGHGCDIDLDDRAEGGLRGATVALPGAGRP